MARGKTTTKTRKRVSLPVSAPATNVLEAGWVLGATCLSCRTHFTSWEPEFQDEDAKHGEYDVFAQLPFTSKDYPICPYCLPWHWRAEAARWGMGRDVRAAYSQVFAS